MAEKFRTSEPDEALLSSLFGTPQELQSESHRRQAQAEAERLELAPDTIQQMPLIEDDWETEGRFIG